MKNHLPTNHSGLIETRSFRVKRQLARLGLSLSVGLIIFAAVSLAIRDLLTTALSACCSLLLFWGYWGAQFLWFHRRR